MLHNDFNSLSSPERVKLIQKYISGYFRKLNELQKGVLLAHEAVFDLPEGSTKDKYSKDFHDMVDHFNRECKLFKKVLESYFELEKKNHLPINFQFRKIYGYIKKV